MAEQQFENLVFEGGGIKGLAYVGALEVMERQGILDEIERIGGTSAGAITALLLALGYEPAETEQIMGNLHFESFLDSSWGVIRNAKRVISQFGWYKGDTFYDWIGEKIADRLGRKEATFLDLKQDDKKTPLYVCGTNLSTGFTEVYSAEHTPNTPIVDAVRISMSIPLFFRAVVDGARGDKYVDGGVQRNYPVKLFDRLKYIDPNKRGRKNNGYDRKTEYYERENRRLLKRHPDSSPYVYNKATLGFRLDEREKAVMFREGTEPPRHKISDFFDYTRAFIRAVFNVQANQHLHSDDWQRTVYIDTLGVGTTDFDISEERKRELVDSGRKHTEEYLAWFEDLERDPAINNRQYREHEFYTD